jgi:hypothetical protein
VNIDRLIAIDTHTHAEVSCCQPPDEFGKAFDQAGIKPEVKPLILKHNAVRLLGLGNG